MKISSKVIFATITGFILPSVLFAQGLTIEPVSQEPVLGAINYTVIAIIALRYIIVSMIVIAAVIAVFKTYLWMTHEGNMLKAYNAKESLAKTVLVITVCFIALSIMHLYIPDYSVLKF